MFVAQPRVFVRTISEILIVRLWRVVVRGTQDLLTLWATEFRIKDASLHNHPLAEVASRKHVVLHLAEAPLPSSRRAARGIGRFSAVLG